MSVFEFGDLALKTVIEKALADGCRSNSNEG
jgi:hypothetical protein